MDLSLLPCFQIQVGEREMASSPRQDWSDEDEDDATQIETSVLLGVPDGPVESASDLKDAAVSRIGGLPVRPIPIQACISILLRIYDATPRLCSPPKSRLSRAIVSTVRIPWNSWCNCGHPLKIALTTGPCMCGAAQEAAARGRAAGMFLMQLAKANGKHVDCYSIRAWRGLRYNEKYALKLERKRAQLAPFEGLKSTHQSVNPFSVRCGQRWRSFALIKHFRCPPRWRRILASAVTC